ncbi:tyrosine-protein kinase PR2-like isoform X1 [Limulus polyphemus]|uniref:Tyrosine-protein kinase PR2-like isoform X1 n=1 Tax=Limulus polyphemus TaxID=6850 RepID=A0ABM1BR86_LIMPO|nr:tyrosine-protein kinase PR2-like isoform X1 [Limulus polyphemus]
MLPKSKEDVDRMFAIFSKTNINTVSSPSSSPDRVISSDSVDIKKEIGIGLFGVVKQGVWTNEHDIKVQVAVKCLNKEMIPNSSADFLKEINVQYSLNNEHVVRLYGVIIDTHSLMMVTELAPQRSLLECLREPVFQRSFSVPTLCYFSQQICDAMKYLESKNLVHQELAARNVLVFGKNKVKVSDFGLSRAMGIGKDFFTATSNGNYKQRIPWYSPEAVKSWTFSSACDVWAFGVTLWEMFSYGEEPWPGFTWNQILDAIDAPNYKRLEQPSHCPKAYFSLMLKCWEHEPADRPSFADLYQIILKSKTEQVRVVKGPTEPESGKTSKVWLKYKLEDVITILDRRPLPNCYNVCKGVLSNGEVGLFHPDDTVPFDGQNTSSSPRSFSIGDGRSGVRRRFTPDMISRPQGDLKHTVHVGVDGTFFGDISFLGNKYSQLPKRMSKYQSSATDEVDGESSPKKSQLNESSTKNSSLIEVLESRSKDKEIGDVSSLDENFDFEAPDLGPSLMDEFLKALGCTNSEELFDCNLDGAAGRNNIFESLDETSHNSNVDVLSLDVDTVELPKAANRNKINDSMFGRESKRSNSLKEQQSIKKELKLRTISASDAESLESAIAMAKKLAEESTFGIDSDPQDPVNQESPKSPISPVKKKFSFRLKISPKAEKRNFSSETECIQDLKLSDEAQDVYHSVVDNGQGIKPSGPTSSSPIFEPVATQPQVSAICHQSTVTIQDNHRHYQSQNRDNQLASRLSKNKDTSNLEETPESNPLRMLRKGGLVQPKVRGNKHQSTPIPSKGTTSRSFVGSRSMASAHDEQCSTLSVSPPLPPVRSTMPSSPASSTLPKPQRHNSCLDEQRETKANSSPASSYSEKKTKFPSNEGPPLPLPRSGISISSLSRLHQRKHPLIANEENETKPLTSLSKQQSLTEVSRSRNDNFSHGKPNKDCDKSFNTMTESALADPKDESTPTTPEPLKTSRTYSTSDSLSNTSGDSSPVEVQRTDKHVSCEDLMGFALDKPNAKRTQGRARGSDSDEVHIMQKVLKDKNVTPEECVVALDETEWDVHKAVKFLQLKRTVNIHTLKAEDLKQTLARLNWNVRKAADFLLAQCMTEEEASLHF